MVDEMVDLRRNGNIPDERSKVNTLDYNGVEWKRTTDALRHCSITGPP